MLLIIANKNYSSWSMRPWLVLKHFNIPFQEETILLKKQNTRQQILEYGKNPLGTLPILIDDDLIIQDSLAICEYLADIYSQLNLWPQTLKQKAQARSIVAQMHSSFVHLRQNYNMNIKRQSKPNDKTIREDNSKLDADIKRIEQIWTELLIQNTQENKPYLFGDFSIADAFFAPVVTRFYSYGVDINKACQKYMQDIINTPAVKAWINLAKTETEIIHEYEV